MPPKKAAPAKLVPSKDSFFMPHRPMVERTVTNVKREEVAQKSAPRRFLYERGTGLQYAEVVGDVAVCVHTGEELFRFRSRQEEEQHSVPFGRQHDFSPPTGARHPNDRTVDVLALVRAGILTDEDVRTRRAFTRDELDSLMEQLH